MAEMAEAKLLLLIFLSFSLLVPQALSVVPEECTAESDDCINKAKALPLKIIAIVSILVTSLIGVCSLLFTRSVQALNPDRDLFVIIKCFAAGIILATGFMHVSPDSFDMLTLQFSPCLKENLWHKFPFTGFVAMLSAIVTLMVDSMATSMYSQKNNVGVIPESETIDGDREMGVVTAAHLHSHGHGRRHHHHHHGAAGKVEATSSWLLRYRVVAMVLELGIVVHSVVIGLGLGASSNVCTIRGLVAALCFHQMSEGMGLGGCILQAEYRWLKKLVMVFFFSVTTPFGIALSSTYQENSPSSLITVGLLNASSAGLLIYMALVDLLAADFMGPKLQRSIKLQIKSYAAVLLGAGGMSLMAKWA
ncbi:fe(2+) transport protein 1-like [Syzygium oleosum]|uniref:fe(2+) transport protein 1-like n=1 Tax=Syzygium oleosum TaxID=219896 RepID=UPI0024B94265|nr:fe(2+) transport protein 1-like [Syzygium oleosum]